MNEEEIYQKALDKWRIESQIKVAVEEMAELTVELMKYGRKINGSTVEDITKEIADVEIMLSQLKVYFGNKEKVENLKKLKLERLEELLK